MKKKYIKPEAELVDLTSKEILMSDGIDPILDAKYGVDIGYASVPEMEDIKWY